MEGEDTPPKLPCVLLLCHNYRSFGDVTVRLPWGGRVATRRHFPLFIPNRNDLKFGIGYFCSM